MDKKVLSQYFSDHRSEMTEDICRLIGIDSVKGAPQPDKPYGPGPAMALDAMAALAKKYGFTVTDHNRRVITADMNDKPQCLDILVHLDVVPGGDGWTVTTPFSPVVKDGRIYGRGSVDDKGPAIAALYAMRAVKELGIELTKNVRLIGGSDEESGMSDIDDYYAHNSAAPMTFSPDADFAVITVEKGKVGGLISAQWSGEHALPGIVSFHCGTSGNMIPGKAEADIAGLSASQIRAAAETLTGETGVAYSLEDTAKGVHIIAVGTGGHAAEPEGSNNALTGMLALLCRLPLAKDGAMQRLCALSDLFPHHEISGKSAGISLHDEHSGDLTAILSVLHLEHNTLSGKIDIRIPLNATRENTIGILAPQMNAAGITIECTYREPHYVPKDTPLVRELLACYETYTGNKGEPQIMGGSTYVHRIPGGVAFGCAMPGNGNHKHGADEFVDMDTLILSAQIFAQTIIDLCQ